ncbi:GDSL esterase/lipase LIP-4-like [Phoenix dactylifera]|uniref:GDSL esterase/lipase LIP-4-like n=1 Tax=Phoenix dactylifera TaxID=42345 RepID=A0A8B9A7W4_PHODC|nr:GDSL esterase/lipase LIP-4-like [Phoenix dactylifera]
MGGGGGLVLWLTISPAFLFLVVVATLTLPALVESACGSNAVVFNFGDSNSDTGGLMAGLGYQIFPPEGRLFFHRSTGRLCDGRLILDFLCESLHMSYLSPYLESVGSDFRNGANFAIAGSTALPPDIPFSLHIQVNQFLRFKARSLELIAQGSKGLINEEGFHKALYAIDIGQNDLSAAFGANLPFDQVIQRIPSVISEIQTAVKTLYSSGGKSFWIHNTGPLGCLPQKLSLPRKDSSSLDRYGCLVPFNNAAKEFNAQLNILCDELRSELNDATIVYTDIFTIKYDIIANHATYGFENPLMACCGYGGPPYNFNQNITCGNAACPVCPEGSKYVNWDGVHYAEAANAIVASKILTTEYSKPKVKFGFFCTA